MADINTLIHAGLPWTNPQKITVKSDEYVSDMTINRGFLQLLNNDYYLDLKAEAINNYLLGVNDHINDTSIHFTKDEFSKLITDNIGLLKHTIFRLPLYEDDNNDYGISRLRHIIQSCPRNLNGYIAGFEFCIPVSRAMGQKIGTTTIDTENYKTLLKLSYSDIDVDVNIKKSPKDFPAICGKNLTSMNLTFDNFFGGTLVVYGNNYFFIDDIANPNIFDNDQGAYDTSIMLKFIQGKIVNTTTPTANETLPTLSGLGLNSKYSVLSFRNVISDTYLFNMKIENTIPSSTTYELSGFNFIEENDVIAYWPLINDFAPQIINENYLTNENYTFNSQSVSSDVISAIITGTTNDIITGMYMNTNYVPDAIPGYLWLDENDEENATSVKRSSNDLKTILYNTNGLHASTTWIMFGYKSANDALTNPFISDYDPSIGSGLCIGSDSIRTSFADPTLNTNDVLKANTYYDSDCTNNWVMYVYEVQHHKSMNPATNPELSQMAPWSWNRSRYQTPPNEGQMRINLRVYYNDPTNPRNIVNHLLLPMHSTDNTDFDVPTIHTTNNIRFFGNKQNNRANNASVNNWNLWNGRCT